MPLGMRSPEHASSSWWWVAAACLVLVLRRSEWKVEALLVPNPLNKLGSIAVDLLFLRPRGGGEVVEVTEVREFSPACSEVEGGGGCLFWRWHHK